MPRGLGGTPPRRHGKKFENHYHSFALYFCWYNWIRKYKAHGTTPAVVVGITDKQMTMKDVVEIIDAGQQSLIQLLRRSRLEQLPQLLSFVRQLIC